MVLRCLIILAVSFAQVLGPGMVARCDATPSGTAPMSCNDRLSGGCGACACPCCQAPSTPSEPTPATPAPNTAERWLTVLAVPPAPRHAIVLASAPRPAFRRAEPLRALSACATRALLCSWQT
ncbi:MAG: hypothetical protein FJ255_04065 [Phycisphaerae bacterium]|nr:hypothetical protein [Phycisphaerae bacterium]